MLDGRWSVEGTEQAIAEWFRLGATRDRKIEVVACANDAMAGAARRVLARYGVDMSQVPLIGCDGLEHEGQVMLAKDEIQATVVVPATTPKALELLSAYWAAGERTEGAAFIDVTSLPALAP